MGGQGSSPILKQYGLSNQPKTKIQGGVTRGGRVQSEKGKGSGQRSRVGLYGLSPHPKLKLKKENGETLKQNQLRCSTTKRLTRRRHPLLAAVAFHSRAFSINSLFSSSLSSTSASLNSVGLVSSNQQRRELVAPAIFNVLPVYASLVAPSSTSTCLFIMDLQFYKNLRMNGKGERARNHLCACDNKNLTGNSLNSP